MYLIRINMISTTMQAFYLEAYSDMNRTMLGPLSHKKVLSYWTVILSSPLKLLNLLFLPKCRQNTLTGISRITVTHG
jgi:hypothetical protein